MIHSKAKRKHIQSEVKIHNYPEKYFNYTNIKNKKWHSLKLDYADE